MFSLTACGTDVVVNENYTNESSDVRFIKHIIESPFGESYSILEDADSGVCYLVYKSEYRYGITVMLNPDGTPKIWEN